MRQDFHLPARAYLCGHSLGPMPRRVPDLLREELETWQYLGVAGHFRGPRPWMQYHQFAREPLARLVGAMPEEVVAMNGLTVNLHLMLASFYTGRAGIVLDTPTFPSDRYAVQSHLAQRGFDWKKHLHEIDNLNDLEKLLARGEVELALLAGVNFLTGEVLDIPRAVQICRRHGVTLGLDLAHAVGNVPLSLHDDGVDFAVWCSYKYLNSGPGAVAGCFVHERHARDTERVRLGGWWGNDPDTRFRMHLLPDFLPVPTADGWQLSNPPVLALAPLLASLELFDAVGMPALRARSLQLGEHFFNRLSEKIEVLSPREPARRGNMVCLRLPHGASAHAQFEAAGIVCDFRPPDVVRAAFCPLYNEEEDIDLFLRALHGEH
jgi:kynureninase